MAFDGDSAVMTAKHCLTKKRKMVKRRRHENVTSDVAKKGEDTGYGDTGRVVKNI